ncbi:MAG: DNA-protecting protein DprA [Chitinophagales bacterium]|nr:DNA-protecting protein DprA [Chitinophagales bacterium]HNI43744.1 DNA-processing protein DprA [Chitinophagales bacterium]
MTEQQLLDYLSLLLIPTVGNITVKTLVSYCGSIERVHNTSKSQLLKIPGLGEKMVDTVLEAPQYRKRAERELKFIEKNQIRVLNYLEPDYPQRLKLCADSPVLLYFKGTGSLEFRRVLSVVGTRQATQYGRDICQKLVADLQDYNVLLVSGLAYGIDYQIHWHCAQQNLPTIGVLAHGLDRVYPLEHADLARKMMENGGIVSEFVSQVLPERDNFPRRNRIIAGMADGTIVVETPMKGGSLVTVRAAAAYNRDVFAFPGRVDDSMSAGCNWLIKQNQATLVESAQDIAAYYGWEKGESPKPDSTQTQLLLDLSEDELLIMNLLREKKTAHIDVICYYTALEQGTVSATLLNMEFRNLVKALPGSIYKLMY